MLTSPKKRVFIIFPLGAGGVGNHTVDKTARTLAFQAHGFKERQT